MNAIVLYDDKCPLCRSLAGFTQRLARSQLEVHPWSEFSHSEQARKIWSEPHLMAPDRIRVIDHATVYEGTAAWEWLLMNHPSLKQLGWLASRLGMQQVTAKALEISGRRIRRICWRCPRY